MKNKTLMFVFVLFFTQRTPCSLAAKSVKAAKGSKPKFSSNSAPSIKKRQGHWSEENHESEYVRLFDNFMELDKAKELREVFDSKFRNPRSGSSDRFVWDWWYVPDQYTLMRTPVEHYFPEDLYKNLVESLTHFGQEMLGCNTISPPWMSLYIDGCEQRLHTDSWHGPWAFVYSLTDWESRCFTGGETVILNPTTVDFWRTFKSKEGLEEQHLVTKVEPFFNRLTVFDPRFPHGVCEVHGTKDPMKGRLVVHGWFTDPTPFFTGGLTEEEATEALNLGLEPIYDSLQDIGRAIGTLTIRIQIDGKTGSVKNVLVLTNTLIPDPNDVDPTEHNTTVDSIVKAINDVILSAQFPASVTLLDTFVTIPFMFE